MCMPCRCTSWGGSSSRTARRHARRMRAGPVAATGSRQRWGCVRWRCPSKPALRPPARPRYVCLCVCALVCIRVHTCASACVPVLPGKAQPLSLLYAVCALHKSFGCWLLNKGFGCRVLNKGFGCRVLNKGFGCRVLNKCFGCRVLNKAVHTGCSARQLCPLCALCELCACSARSEWDTHIYTHARTHTREHIVT